MLVRVNTARLGKLLEVGRPHAKAAGTSWLSPIDRPEALVATAFLSDMFGGFDGLAGKRYWWRQLARANDQDFEELSTFLPSIDGSRPMLLAFSTRGEDQVLRRLQYGVPPYSWDSFPLGYSTRVYIPATDPKKLRAEIEELPSKLRRGSKAVRRVDTADGYVIVDALAPGPRERFVPETVDINWAATDDAYWQRDTTALRAFLKNDAAVAVYVRGEDVPVLGALNGASMAAEALGHAAPDNKLSMYNRGFWLAGQLPLLANAQGREFEDITLTFDTDDRDGVVAEIHRTHTARGAVIAEAGDIDVELASINVEEPLLELEWARDSVGTQRVVKSPRWLRPWLAGQRSMGELSELFRTGGSWALLVPMLNYPESFANGLDAVVHESAAPQLAGLARLQELYALRVRLELVDDNSTSLGFAPRGGVVAVVHKNSELVDSVERFVSQMRQALPFEYDVETETVGDKATIRVAVGASDEIFGPSTSTRTFATRMNVAGITDHLDIGAIPAGLAGLRGLETVETMMHVLEGTKQIRIEHEQSEKASAIRFHMGTAVLDALSIAHGTQPLTEPQTPPECLREAIDASREALEQLDRTTAQTRPALFTELHDRLDAAENNCRALAPETRAELDWIRSRWQRYAGRHWANQLRWARSLEQFKQACQSGDEGACSDRDEVRQRQSNLRFAHVADASVTIESIPQDSLIVTRDGLASSTFQIYPMRDAPEVSLAALDSDDAVRSRALEDKFGRLTTQTVEPSGQGQVSAVLLPIDARVSSKTAQAMVEIAHQMDLERERKIARLRGHNVPEGPAAAGFVVARPEGQTPHLGVLVMRIASDQSRPTTAPLTLTVTEAGVGLEYAGQSLDPIEGCPENGPTLCVTDAEKASGYVSSLLGGGTDGDMPPEEQAQALAKLAKAYRTEALSEQLDTIEWPSESIHVVIRTETEVPFGLLARLHGELNAWATQRDSTNARPVVVLESR